MERVHGFDEDMIHGWHVDLNLWKRIYNHTAHIGTLYPDIAEYHTNHNRTLTRLMAAQPTGNDLGTFVYEVEHSSLPAQADTWGFAGVEVQEMRLGRANPVPLLMAASARAQGQAGPLITSDIREQMSVLGYDARHILPFALDPVIGEHPKPSVGYVGINDPTAMMLTAGVAALGFPGPIPRGDAAARAADVVVLDMGVDTSTGRGPLTPREGDQLVAMLRSAVNILRVREPAPRILLINAISGIWEQWARALFSLSYGTFHTRIQSAELRDDEPTDAVDLWALQALKALHFATRRQDEFARALRDSNGDRLDLAAGPDYSGLDAGWEGVDEVGAFVGHGCAAVRFMTDGDMPDLVNFVLDLASWSTADGETDPLSVAFILDDREVFAGVIDPLRSRGLRGGDRPPRPTREYPRDHPGQVGTDPRADRSGYHQRRSALRA